VTPAQPPASRLPPLLRVLRLHQWAKGALVFLAPLGAHRLGERGVLTASIAAFLAFGLVASALYVANDLHDLAADRLHPLKRHRPFASGQLGPAAGWLLIPALLAAGFALSALLPRPFTLVLAGYAVATTAYSAALKRVPVADVLLLAGLYTLRIYGGAAATGVPVSEWLATFSMFFFLSLALLKRGSELLAVEGAPAGRGYRAVDREPVFAMGTASGYVSVLVLALYVSGPEVRHLYRTPAWLWALCPLVLYWVSRLWLLARRGEVTDDPVVVALRDRTTWLVGALAGLVLWLGTRG
jgi:4-hydroxybenzoate polyprenyltransferase